MASYFEVMVNVGMPCQKYGKLQLALKNGGESWDKNKLCSSTKFKLLILIGMGTTHHVSHIFFWYWFWTTSNVRSAFENSSWVSKLLTANWQLIKLNTFQHQKCRSSICFLQQHSGLSKLIAITKQTIFMNLPFFINPNPQTIPPPNNNWKNLNYFFHAQTKKQKNFAPNNQLFLMPNLEAEILSLDP